MPARSAPSRLPLVLAVSPYHLTTRELPAAVALTLADEAFTIVPEPVEGAGREQVRETVDRVPRLLRVLESWRWSGPLWKAGMISGELNRERLFRELQAQSQQLLAETGLRGLGDVQPFPLAPGDAADRWLDAFCSDLLRGGPSPHLSTLTVGALDRVAAEHGMIAIRGSTNSLAQRAELKLLRRRFSVALPVMSRAAGGRVLELRRALEGELKSLRAALGLAAGEIESPGRGDSQSQLTEAVERYSAAFETWFAKAARDDENAERTMRAYVGITGGRLPADAAMVSAHAALRTASIAGPVATRAARTHERVADLKVFIVRELNVRPT
jgi:hypothetical protein